MRAVRRLFLRLWPFRSGDFSRVPRSGRCSTSAGTQQTTIPATTMRALEADEGGGRLHLPVDVLEAIARAADPTVRGVLRHVSPELRAAVKSDAEASAAMKIPVVCGRLELLRWARKQGCPWSEETFVAAAGGGHLEVLRWLREQGCPWGKKTFAAAAEGGHLEVLRR